VIGLPPTSTIRTRPLASRWVSLGASGGFVRVRVLDAIGNAVELMPGGRPCTIMRMPGLGVDPGKLANGG
jgi:hypothetical protein